MPYSSLIPCYYLVIVVGSLFCTVFAKNNSVIIVGKNFAGNYTMPATDGKLTKYDVISRLLHLIDGISEDQQFVLFTHLFKDSLANQLLKRIIDLSENQRLILMKHLEELASENNNGDKRKAPRKDCLINTNIRVQGSIYNSYILDINQYGAYIETNKSFSVGQEMKLTFATLNSREPLNICGEVIRKDAQGVGVKFQILSERELKTIRSFVENSEVVYEINS
jgi:Tfp pilus assembly protein PilZ